jgi:bifunctional non-homologous end joining protein LigD
VEGTLVAELALATPAKAFSGPGWVFEPKYDGFCLQVAKSAGEVALRYRSGRDATDVFPEIVDAVAALPADGALLDGELVAIDPQGRPDFELLRARALRRPSPTTPRADARVCAFDLLALGGDDLRLLPLLERKQLLWDLLANAHHHLLGKASREPNREPLKVDCRVTFHSDVRRPP